jgi:hypothetical protein
VPEQPLDAGELADEAIRRGIVKRIFERHVGSFLKSSRFQTAQKSLLAQCGPDVLADEKRAT